MMTDEIKTEEKKENKFKIFLGKHMNNKLQILIFLLLFTIFNRIIGFFDSGEMGVNIILIMVAFVVIGAIDGIFKHKEDK